MWRGSTSRPEGEARCHRCRRPDCGTTASYGRGCRCDACKEAKRRYQAEYVSRRAAEGRPIDFASYRATVRRECKHCGMPFDARLDNVRNGKGLFCSRQCQGVATREALGYQPRPIRKSAVRRRAERRMAAAAKGTTGGNLVWIQGACHVCGADFLSRGASSRYCSRPCARKAQRRRNWIAYPERLAIYKRDGYVCHICGESASREFDHADPWSPTLDHLVPRSLGGSDSPENLSTAHLWCNSVRGDLTHFTDGDLQGVVVNGATR